MRNALSNLNEEKCPWQHPGLLLQKYAADLDKPDVKKKCMEFAIVASASPSVSELYGQAYPRWIKTFPADKFHLSFSAATTNRLIIGLGTANVLEAGIRLHQIYGTPLIPGSALKGLAAHYCHEVWGQIQNDKAEEETKKFRNDGDYHRILFGDTDKSGRGMIAFHDAWILPESLKGALRMDVMTPHHQDWQTQKQAPTDFDSPVPVSFLSVSGTFQCLLSWAGPMDHSPEEIQQWLKLAQALLTEALSEWGAGAKTSSGYGRLVPPESLPKQNASGIKPKQVSYKAGDSVQAVLCEERTKKGGWKAKEKETEMIGPINNSPNVPASLHAGNEVTLEIASFTDKIAFNYPITVERKSANHLAGKKNQRGK